MDERHWWIATKLQESFKIGPRDSPTLFEDFFADSEVVDRIDSFLGVGGHTILFFCLVRKEKEGGGRSLHLATSAVNLREVVNGEASCLFFIRARIKRDVDPTSVEREVYVGEIKSDVLHQFSNTVSNIFLPLVKAQKFWGESEEEDITHFCYQLDKYSVTFQNLATAVAAPQQLLRSPTEQILYDFKQNRAAAVNYAVVSEYETLIHDWILTIDSLLSENIEERNETLSGPLSELQHWLKRQRLLQSVAEQLKNKECKSVIGVLIAAKSKVLKRWRVIDACITDAMNETKDKIKYLESLRRHFDDLYHDYPPAYIANTTLPALISNVRQMDAITKFYARTGFLGTIFMKVTNQLVLLCKRYIEGCVDIDKEQDVDNMAEVIERDTEQSRFVAAKLVKKRKGRGNFIDTDEGLLGRLQSCVSLFKQHADMLHHLRDALGGAHALAHIPASQATGAAKKGHIPLGSHVNVNSSTVSNTSSRVNAASTPTLAQMGLERFRVGGSISSSSGALTGVAFTDDDVMLSAMEPFIHRMHQMIELMDTLAQFKTLLKKTCNLPKINLMLEKQISLSMDEDNLHEETSEESEDENGPASTLGGAQEANQQVIDDISHEIRNHMNHLSDEIIKKITAKVFLSIDARSKPGFASLYGEFNKSVQNLEQVLVTYVEQVFSQRLSIKRALQILTSFLSVSTRPNLRPVLTEKFVEVFLWYEQDLEEVQKDYESRKDNPPLARDAPRVAGAIYWAHSLLWKIEDPMKIFRDVKFVSSLKDFSRITKVYNGIAARLLKYEEHWLSIWRSQIDGVRVCLKAPLLALNPENKEIMVNCDGRILLLLKEVKWLRRLNIAVPEAALDIAKQEKKFKGYYHHLQYLLTSYRDICQKVPIPLQRTMKPTMESVRHYLQPAFVTLCWNSTNIDLFLCQVQSALTSLEKIVDTVNDIVSNKLEKNIKNIGDLICYLSPKALTRVWNVEDFVAQEEKATSKVASSLHQYTSLVERSLKEILDVVSNDRFTGTPSRQSSPYSVKNLKSSSRASNQSNIFSALAPPETYLTNKGNVSPLEGAVEDAAISELYVYYCSQVYDAVLQSTISSLTRLADCVQSDEMKEHWTPDRFLLTSPTLKHERLAKFNITVSFQLPDIVIDPQLISIEDAINNVVESILDVNKQVLWFAKDTKETFYSSIVENVDVQSLKQCISNAVNGFVDQLDSLFLVFRQFDFLWQDDMQVLYNGFSDANPTLEEFHREVKRLENVEKSLKEIPSNISAGILIFDVTPLKDSLLGFAIAWKTCYSRDIHESTKRELQKLVNQRESYFQQLVGEVSSLDHLNIVLNVLQEVADMENSVDEYTYRSYGIRIPREEIEEVETLRTKWSDLVTLSEKVRLELLHEKRSKFEQELDKQIKGFVVEVIQFRNSFDSQGPGVHGISPTIAVERLSKFQAFYDELNERRKTLSAVQLLFGNSATVFPELDKTGEELQLLGMLYGLFQRLIAFDEKFREKLWADVNLVQCNEELKKIWNEASNLPEAIRSWSAFKDMNSATQSYLDVFPLLHKLASKEIRNRHWLQVMAVTGSSFQLEANVLKLMHLLDIGLVSHRDQIDTIVLNARKELEIEVRLKAIEEEWTEQVLSFDKFKHRGLVCLAKANTEKQIDLLEDAKASLALMLTSKHIAPMRDTAAGWAVKLKEMGEVLDQWLTVQELWKCFEEVFSSPETMKELPLEYARFSKIDRTYIRMIKKAVETRNVLQCCVGGDIPKSQLLKGLHEELESCFKSLSVYLDCKREEFPRFYFVSNSSLLSILSKPYNLESISPYLRDIFAGVRHVEDLVMETKDAKSRGVSRQASKHNVQFSLDTAESNGLSATSEERKSSFRLSTRLDSNANVIPAQDQVSGNLEWRSQLPVYKMVAVRDEFGETLKLRQQVLVEGGVDQWLNALLKEMRFSVAESIHKCLADVENGLSIDEWAIKYPAQVSLLALLFIWTKECEVGISEIRTDRKSLASASKRFNSVFNRIPTILSKRSWKSSESNSRPFHIARLEGLLSLGLFLRDVTEDLGKRKLREVGDFDWQRNLRLYRGEADGTQVSNDGIAICLHDAKLPYGNEFLSCKFPLMLTPLTERCFFALTQAIQQHNAGSLCGPGSTGKTQTVKGLAHIFGRFLVSISILPELELAMFGRIFKGAAKDGCWCLLNDLHRASSESLSVLMYYAQHFLNALRIRAEACYLPNKEEVSVHPDFALFSTMILNKDNSGVPNDVSSLFRTVKMTTPDNILILRGYLAAEGFKTYKVLADKIQLVADICIGQLVLVKDQHFGISSLTAVVKLAGLLKTSSNTRGASSKSDATRVDSALSSVLTFSQTGGKDRGKDKKQGAVNQLVGVAKLEQTAVMQALLEYIGSRLPEEDKVVLLSVGKSVFGSVFDKSLFPVPLPREEQVIETCLSKHANEHGWVPRKSWISKSLLLYQLSKVHQGIILCGKACSGKSSCLQNLVESLSEVSVQKHGSTSSQVHTHKLEKLNIMAVSNLSQMFGGFNQQGDWEDGFFSSLWKRANREHSVHLTTSWLCFDAPLHNSWCEHLKPVIEEGRCLTLSNLERWPMSKYVRIVIETDDIKNASPSLISGMGIVYMDDDVLGWKPLADSWLSSRPKHQSLVFQRSFNKVMDAVMQFIQNEVRLCHPLPETALFSSCLDLLTALLKEHTDIGGDFHLERLFLFSLIWTVGGMIKEEDERRLFSQLLLGSNVPLPDYDHEISVFDYYVDESGEWDLWESRLQEAVFDDSADLLGHVFIETEETMRVRFFMELTNLVGKNVMVMGPRGSGKTTVINDVLGKFDTKQQIFKRVVFSANSTAQFFQSFMDSSIHHRQGFVYGAKNGKNFHIFVDDVQLPKRNNAGIQPVNELLRQLLDQKMVLNLRKPFDRKFIEGISMTATMTIPSHADSFISERLLRHFLTIQLPYPSKKTSLMLFSSILEANMTHGSCPGLPQELHDNIVEASDTILRCCQEVLRCSILPGRESYCFNMKDIVRIFQSLKSCPEELRGDEEYFVSFWQHEIKRVFQDQVAQIQDLNWLEDNIKETTRKFFPELPANSRQPTFITFASNRHLQTQRSTTGLLKGSSKKNQHEAVDNLDEVTSCIDAYYHRYIDETGCSPPMTLSHEIIKSIVRIQRILSQRASSNALLIGSVGSHLSSLARMALFMMNCRVQDIDCTSRSSFYEGIKTAIRAAASDGQQIAVILTAIDLHDSLYLDILNSLLVSGGYPSLFSEDELQGLVLALLPVIKRKHPNYLLDPMKFFTTQLKLHLSVVICLSPDHPVFLTLGREYPGILSSCQLYRFVDWTQEALVGEASHYFSEKSFLSSFDLKIRDNVIATLASIHSHVLKECNQIPWFNCKGGDMSTSTEDKFPLSMKIVVDKITKKSSCFPSDTEVTVGPTAYQRLLHCFRHLFNSKYEEVSERRSLQRKALSALEQTRADLTEMKTKVAKLKEEFNVAVSDTANLMELVISKATIIERLKAKCNGGEDSSLNAFMALIESEMEEDEDETLFLDDYDELDEEYERIKSAQLQRSSRSLEASIEESKTALDKAKYQLERAKNQAESFQKRIDRGCIERVRAYQSPPPLVGVIVFMVMVLIRRPEFNNYVLQFSAKGDKKGDQTSTSDDVSSVSSPSGRRRREKPQPSIGPDGRIDKSTWKTMQLIMNDTQKFAEVLNNFKWLDGIPDDIMKAVVSFFAPGEEVPRYENAKGASASSSSITPRYSSYSVNPRPAVTPVNQDKKFQGITLAAARHSSEDAAQLVEFVQSIIDFYLRQRPYKKAEANLRDLIEEQEEQDRNKKENKQIVVEEEDNEPEHIDPMEGLSVEDLSRLIQESNELQKEFDAAAIKKHDLQNEITSCLDRLKAVISLLDGLQQLETSWKSYVEDYVSLDVLLANCIMAAAYLTYCGQLEIDQREDMKGMLLKFCQAQDIPFERKRLFEDTTLPKYLAGKAILEGEEMASVPLLSNGFYSHFLRLTLLQWDTCEIPNDLVSLENIAMATQQRCCDAWPLICDRLGISTEWLQKMIPDGKMIKLKELKNELETCLTEGKTLVLCEVELSDLESEKRVYDVIRARKMFIQKFSSFKLTVGEEEIECSPSFRLFLVTYQPVSEVPVGAAAYLNIVEFTQSRHGLMERFLRRFIELEKPRIHSTSLQVARDIHRNMRLMVESEHALLLSLAEKQKPLDDLQSIKKIKGIKRQYDEALESLLRTQEVKDSVKKSLTTYKPVAVRASVLLDAAQAMSHIKPFYGSSIKQFLWVFDASIKHSERNAITAVVERLQQNAFMSFSKGLIEEDKILFGLLVALEVCDSLGKIEVGDREFIISPPFGAAVKLRRLDDTDKDTQPKTSGKKPFDWMLDEQYHNLQLLAQNFEWFSEAFERMTRDGREMQWRQLAEHERPELVTLPDNLDEKFSPVQRLMVLRALRSDRLIQTASVFVRMVLGKKYVCEGALDLTSTLRYSSNRSPILVVYQKEHEVVERSLTEAAAARQIPLRIIRLPYLEDDSVIVKGIIQAALSEGYWVLILNFQHSCHLWTCVEPLLQEAKFVNPGFRLWISVSYASALPRSLLHNSARVVVDSPLMSVRDSLCSAIAWVNSDIWKSSTRNDWIPLLHNICMLHSTLRFRSRYEFVGYNIPEDFQFKVEKLWDLIAVAAKEFGDVSSSDSSTSVATVTSQRSLQWNALRYIITEIIYGSCVTDNVDRVALGTMVDFWINSQSTKKDFEMTRAKYKLPAAIFQPGIRLPGVLQSLEAIDIGSLEVPEICGLHSSDETILSYDQYVFSRLNLIYDKLSTSSTLLHLVPVNEGIPSASAPVVVSSGSSHSLGAGLLALTTVGVFASASMTALKVSREVDLNEICSSSLSKLPKLWSRDLISDRVKKTGGLTAFNQFLLAEIENMFILYHEVKRSLQEIKEATSGGVYGDCLSLEALSIAEDIYYMKVPKKWCDLAGPTSVPSVLGLQAWLTDVQNRYSHLERLLIQGREKIPAYWLAAFYNPRRLLAVILEEAVRTRELKHSITEQHVLRTEITGRDKDHLREPPSEGIFVYGAYLWGCAWEKTSCEIQDIPPKSGPSPLPVIHITAIPISEKQCSVENVKTTNVFECPCFPSRICPRKPVMFVDIEQKDIPSSRWPLRGIACTLRPF